MILINLLITVRKVKKVHKLLVLFYLQFYVFLNFIFEVTSLSILTNHFTKKWTKFNAAICWRHEHKRHRRRRRECYWRRRTHRNSTPNFFSTETFHRNAEGAPNAHRVAMRNAYCCVLQRLAQMMVQCGTVRGRNTPRRQLMHTKYFAKWKMAARTLCCIRSLWFDAFKQIKYEIKLKLTI